MTEEEAMIIASKVRGTGIGCSDRENHEIAASIVMEEFEAAILASAKRERVLEGALEFAHMALAHQVGFRARIKQIGGEEAVDAMSEAEKDRIRREIHEMNAIIDAAFDKTRQALKEKSA